MREDLGLVAEQVGRGSLRLRTAAGRSRLGDCVFQFNAAGRRFGTLYKKIK